jgi:hypothetical protein
MDFLSTLFRQQSRRVGVMVPDVVVSEKHSDQLEITEHPVERQTAEGTGTVADHAYRRPSEVTMEVGFAGGGSLLDFADTTSFGLSTPLNPMSPTDVYEALIQMQRSREPLDVVTGKRTYSNMLIRGLEVNTDKTTENVLSATLTLREVILTSATTIQVDKSDMATGASTSPVLNTGTKTPVEVNQNKSFLRGGFDFLSGS